MGVMGCHGQSQVWEGLGDGIDGLSRTTVPASERWFVSQRHLRQRDRTVILLFEVVSSDSSQTENSSDFA